MIEHINDDYLEITFNNFQHLLAENGYIIITTPNDEILENNMICCPECEVIFHRWQHIRSWSTSALRKIIEGYGFKIEKIYTTFFNPKVEERKSYSGLIADFIRKYILLRKTPKKINSNLKAPHLVAIIKK